jgi:hypothetical protein
MATKYLDLSGGNDANDGSSFANRKKTFASVSGVAAAGDTIRVMKSDDPVSLGINMTVTSNSGTVTLASALTANIETCESGWTAGAGVTVSYSTTSKEGTNCVVCTIGGGYVTGNIVAYKTIASTDFSAYEQISCMFKCNAVTAAADWEIRLCSDTVGAVAVDTFSLPAQLTTGFAPLVYNKAAALGAAIQSIAIYRIAGSGTPIVSLDNVIACKAASASDCITHRHLIGKNSAPSNTTSGVKEWFQIKSINGTTVILDHYGDATPGIPVPPYWTSETVAAYVRLPITVTAAQTFATPIGTIAGGDVTIQGGYNTADMTSVTGDTYFRYPGSATNICMTSGTRQTFNNMHFIGGATVITLASLGFQTFTSCSFIGGGSFLADNRSGTGGNTTFDSCFFTGSQYSIGMGGGFHKFRNCRFNGAGRFSGLILSAHSCLIEKTFIASSLSTCGVQINDSSLTGGMAHNNLFRNCEFQNNLADVVAYTGPNYFDNCTFGSATEVSYLGNPGTKATIMSTNHDQTADNHQQWHEASGKIISDTSTRHTASGISWKYSPLNTVRASTYPIRDIIGTLYAASGAVITVSVWVRRDNTGLTMTLYARDGQLGGPTTAQSASITAAINTWEQINISWTAGSSGVVEIEMLVYGGTTYNGWVDDLSVTYA